MRYSRAFFPADSPRSPNDGRFMKTSLSHVAHLRVSTMLNAGGRCGGIGKYLPGPIADRGPVTQVTSLYAVTPRRIDAAEQTHRHRHQPHRSRECPVELLTAAPPGLLVVAARAHPENSYL